jgi:hypothetical protein
MTTMSNYLQFRQELDALMDKYGVAIGADSSIEDYFFGEGDYEDVY